MNVFLLMSGGVGNRFGANIPKQYVELNGKPVIEYVLEACLEAKKVDKIVVVMDQQYINISKLLKNEKIFITNNGNDRYSSLKNGLEYIHDNFECENVLIADAVAPFIYPELIDDYFNKLDEYDMVLTGQKITGALCDFEGNKYDREDFFMAQAPEVFKFKMLYENVDYSSKYQAISALMPKSAKRYVNFNFKNNLKLTYNFELKYAEFLFNYQKHDESKNFDSIVSSSFFETKGIKDYLLRIRKKETQNWLQEVYLYFESLEKQNGKFKNVILNQSSNNGIVMILESLNDEFVLKIVPKFLNRYENEKKCYQIFSKDFMCELLAFDDDNNALYLKKLDVNNGKIFDDNIKLTDFFNRVIENRVEFNSVEHDSFEKIIDNLNCKLKRIDELPYLKEEINGILQKAISFYDSEFQNSKLYVIHGDLRQENILQIDNKFVAIDPIGYVAPIEMEPARFIIGDIYKNKGYSPMLRLDILLTYFSKWFNLEKTLIGLYIFFVMITYNSVLENETDTITSDYLNIINQIEKKILKITK